MGDAPRQGGREPMRDVTALASAGAFDERFDMRPPAATSTDLDVAIADRLTLNNGS